MKTLIEKLNVTETPVIKAMIKLEDKGLIFNRDIVNNILWEMKVQVETEKCKALLKDIEKDIEFNNNNDTIAPDDLELFNDGLIRTKQLIRKGIK